MQNYPWISCTFDSIVGAYEIADMIWVSVFQLLWILICKETYNFKWILFTHPHSLLRLQLQFSATTMKLVLPLLLLFCFGIPFETGRKSQGTKTENKTRSIIFSVYKFL